MDTISKISTSGNSKGKSENSVTAQFFIFHGLDYIGNDNFSKERVSIGRSDQADICLNHPAISDIHAFVYFKDNQVIVSNQNPDNGLRINGKSIKLAFLNPLDVLDIGPYSLKVKINRSEEKETQILNGTVDTVDNVDTPEPIGVSEAVEDVDIVDPEPEVEEEEIGVYEIYRPKPTIYSSSEHPAEDDTPVVSSKRDTNKFEPKTPESPALPEKKTTRAVLEPAVTTRLGKVHDEKRYQLVFQGRIKPGFDLHKVRKNLAELFNTNEKQIVKLFCGTSVILKKDLDRTTAQKHKQGFELSGALCTIREMGIPEAESDPGGKLQTDDSKQEERSAASEVASKQKVGAPARHFSEKIPQSRTAATVSSATAFLEEDDEDEDDHEAPWSLREKLLAALPAAGSERVGRGHGDKRIEIIKFRKDGVEDVRYLGIRSKFKIRNRNAALTLAEHKSNNRLFFYFHENFTGEVQGGDSSTVSLDNLKTGGNIFRRRKRLYRCRIPAAGRVILNDGINEYLIRSVIENKRPDIQGGPAKKLFSWRHWTTSVVFHLVFFLFLGIIPFFTGDEATNPEVRFVKIDPSQLAHLDKKVEPVEKPKPKPEPPKPKEKPPVVEPKKEPVKVKKTKEKPVKQKPKATVAKANKAPAKTNTPIVPSQHPDAGGGHGKGNVVNRDINQTGILSMIGEGIGAAPSSAIAAVTNLDAVTSPGAGDKNFKVGGVKGKLGNGKISVPTSGVVQTKGSKQVLRSAGAGGNGRVAALEKGQVGQKAVKGLVTARLTKSVQIKGGMSREAVKQVIDQHMDEIYFCYETALLGNPSIMGRMVYEWRIMMNGSVGEVSIKSSSVNSHEMHACIKEAIKSWRFPQPSGTEVIVSYPFVFDIVGF